ncbi:isocitrate lyase/phosphoenolpyruvate mutase family protein, partial [Streptomyces toxytricini]|uniref:isocitrate lyase/phosphoenolpyruvate mutase family protein n=1 Tax=Streptomyces toxytricini TaxID=67369 RepID=UPI003433E1B3
MTTAVELARRFAALHDPAAPLALANAWDVVSARLVEAAGAPAVATTSAGVAWSLGAPDGDALARDRAVDLVARVASAVSVPVTADIEGGFAADPAGVGETVAAVLAAGAVGINIEADEGRHGLVEAAA